MTRSIRNFLASHNLLAVSANRQETAINTGAGIGHYHAGGPEHRN